VMEYWSNEVMRFIASLCEKPSALVRPRPRFLQSFEDENEDERMALHHSVTRLLQFHHSITPLFHYSNVPLLHYCISPTSPRA